MDRQAAARAAFGEAVLSLLTGRPRAEAIAGDLVEATRGRACCLFWLYLASVSLALLAAGLRSAAWRAAWLLGSGLALWAALYASIRAAGAALGLHPFDGRGIDCLARPLSATLYLAAALALSNFATGLLLGARARSGGLNAGVPLASFWALLAVALPLAASAEWHCILSYVAGLPLLYVAPLLYGAALSAARSSAARAA